MRVGASALMVHHGIDKLGNPAGFDGSFGQRTWGRLHDITPPQAVGPRSVVYYVDCGRADLEAIPDLLRRLAVLDSQQPIRTVLIGEGYLPA